MSTPDAGSNATPTTASAIDDAISRTVAIGGLAAVALIHALQLPDAFAEASYLGWLFVGASVAAVGLLATLTHASDRSVWRATATLPALILLGYLLSRTTGLPGANSDVGEWDEPLGLASIVAESVVLCVSSGMLVTRRHRTRARAAGSVGAPARRVRGSAERPRRGVSSVARHATRSRPHESVREPARDRRRRVSPAQSAEPRAVAPGAFTTAPRPRKCDASMPSGERMPWGHADYESQLNERLIGDTGPFRI